MPAHSDAAHTPVEGGGKGGKRWKREREREREHLPFGRELCCELEPRAACSPKSGGGKGEREGELIAISAMHRPLHHGITRMLLFPRGGSYFAREHVVVRATSAAAAMPEILESS